MVGDPPMGKGSKLEIMHLSVCAQISLTTDFYIYDVFNTRFLYLHLPVQVARGGIFTNMCIFLLFSLNIMSRDGGIRLLGSRFAQEENF